jgi:hypothetical protein
VRGEGESRAYVLDRVSRHNQPIRCICSSVSRARLSRRALVASGPFHMLSRRSSGSLYNSLPSSQATVAVLALITAASKGLPPFRRRYGKIRASTVGSSVWRCNLARMWRRFNRVSRPSSASAAHPLYPSDTNDWIDPVVYMCDAREGRCRRKHRLAGPTFHRDARDSRDSPKLVAVSEASRRVVTTRASPSHLPRVFPLSGLRMLRLG